jgi:hypothetical protein
MLAIIAGDWPSRTSRLALPCTIPFATSDRTVISQVRILKGRIFHILLWFSISWLARVDKDQST